MDNYKSGLEWRLELVRDLLAEVRPLAWVSDEAHEQAESIIRNSLASMEHKRGQDYATILCRRYADGEKFVSIGDGRRERGRQRVARGLRMLRWQIRLQGELEELQNCITGGDDDREYGTDSCRPVPDGQHRRRRRVGLG